MLKGHIRALIFTRFEPYMRKTKTKSARRIVSGADARIPPLNPRWTLSRQKELRANGAAEALKIVGYDSDEAILELAMMLHASSKTTATSRAVGGAASL